VSRITLKLSAAFVTVAALYATSQTRTSASERNRLTVECYWSSYVEALVRLATMSPNYQGEPYIPSGGCERYKDPTHCKRTFWEMLDDSSRGKRVWQRVTANGLIFTITCAKNCKRFPGPGDSYDAETDGKLMWIRFEKPDKKDQVEVFEIFDISPAKENTTATTESVKASESTTTSKTAEAPKDSPVSQKNDRKTPAQILDKSRGSVAVIVAAGDTSAKLGTGFFLHSTGMLLTNLHVVEGTDFVGVKLPMRSDILWAKKAKGFDLDNDLALLAVEASGVEAVTLGDSDNVRVGDPIVVVSNPEGLEQTISNGLISGIRDLDGRKLFQISAPISEGSSGGPVFNERGEVIGVVVSSLRSGQNLNFAVPINYAKPLLYWPTAIPITALPRPKVVDEDSNDKASVTQPRVSDDLPKFWKNTLSGDKTEITIDGDYLYEEEKEQVTLAIGGGEVERHCETKRNGSEWWGKCNHYMTAYALWLSQSCSWVTQEIITSVTATRIEGKSQNDPTPEGGACPIPAAGWHEFALIPSD
jgi:hypothetical protein